MVRRPIHRPTATLGGLLMFLALSACASGPGGGSDGGGPSGGGPGGMGGPRGGPGGMGMMATDEVPRDAATIALRFRNELALSDNQVGAFSGIKHRLDSAAAPLRRQLDSLTVDPRGLRDENEAQRTATQARLRARANVVRALKEQVQDVRAEVLLALTDRQRTQMQVIEDAMKDDRPSGFGGPGGMGGPGGGMGGGRPRGGGGRPPA